MTKPNTNETEDFTEDTEEEFSENETVVPVNEAKTYGISTDRFNVTTWKRSYQEVEEVVIQKKGRGAGREKVIPVGFTKWVHTERPHQSSLGNALRLIAEFMILERLEESRDIKILADYVSEVLQEIKEFGNGLKKNA